MKKLPWIVIHIIVNAYEEKKHLHSLSQGRETKLRERKIANLSQWLSKVGEWIDFLIARTIVA